jgi:hypothetical protein
MRTVESKSIQCKSLSEVKDRHKRSSHAVIKNCVTQNPPSLHPLKLLDVRLQLSRKQTGRRQTADGSLPLRYRIALVRKSYREKQNPIVVIHVRTKNTGYGLQMASSLLICNYDTEQYINANGTYEPKSRILWLQL